MLTTESTKLAVHALVTIRLDNCDIFILTDGINKTLLNKLPNVQHTARLIANKMKYDPVTNNIILLRIIGCQLMKGLISRSWSSLSSLPI